MEIAKIIRKTCQGFEPYIAGKPIETLKRELGLSSVVKLASNENPLGASKKALKAIKENLYKVFFYPDSNSYELKEALSKRYSLPTSNIFTGAGGDEIIELIAKLFFESEDEIVISKHTFIRYAMAAKLMGSKAIVVPMKDGFVYDLLGLVKACTKKTKAVFVTNPNNPTGTYSTKAELMEFLQKLPLNKFGVKPLVILDEAYFEYASLEKDYPDGLNFLKDNPNLIIFRTFSKIYGLAGLRVAYGFANKQIVDYIERTRPPFNVNLLAQVAAAAAITDKEQVIKSQEFVKEEKEYLYKELKKLKIEYIISATNFVLFNSLPLKGKELFMKLLKEGVIVRAMDEYELSYWVRVTVGLHKENELFIRKLKVLIRDSKK
ncbi:MAG: histidinol-phosphate transaminase [Endomicrobium sp.]|jgi:histidinol-phosphate aminotransferase|nr:histidinol-phosphate transaminase [Endomicrobium sp.]